MEKNIEKVVVFYSKIHAITFFRALALENILIATMEKGKIFIFSQQKGN